MKKLLIIDAQGGGVGSALCKEIKKLCPEQTITAVGTNSLATLAMLKSGADHGATGENAVMHCCKDADIILGPIGIVLKDAMLGEVTEAMAAAIGGSNAVKLLIPMQRCGVFIAGVTDMPLGRYVTQIAEHVKALI